MDLITVTPSSIQGNTSRFLIQTWAFSSSLLLHRHQHPRDDPNTNTPGLTHWKSWGSAPTAFPAARVSFCDVLRTDRIGDSLNDSGGPTQANRQDASPAGCFETSTRLLVLLLRWFTSSRRYQETLVNAIHCSD